MFLSSPWATDRIWRYDPTPPGSAVPRRNCNPPSDISNPRSHRILRPWLRRGHLSRSRTLGLGDGHASSAGEKRGRGRKAKGPRNWSIPSEIGGKALGTGLCHRHQTAKPPTSPASAGRQYPFGPNPGYNRGLTAWLPSARHIRVPSNSCAQGFGRQVETKYSRIFSVHELCTTSQLLHIFPTSLST